MQLLTILQMKGVFDCQKIITNFIFRIHGEELLGTLREGDLTWA